MNQIKREIGWVALYSILAIILVPGVKTQNLPDPYVRGNLSITIIVRYPETQLTSNQQTTDLFIVGNGLGLAWNDPTRLIKSSGARDTWSIELSFSGSTAGYGCSQCVYSNVLSYNDRFEYRILTSNKIDMIGANFGLPLHQSRSEPYFGGRQYIATPYFFSRSGKISETPVTSATDSMIGTRRWNYYLPSSFSENTYKTYPTLFVFDMNPIFLESLKSTAELMTVDLAVSEELVVIGSGDYAVPNTQNHGRYLMLTPSQGVDWLCNEGDYSDRCNGCVPPEADLFLVEDKRLYYEALKNGCGYPYVTGGHGNQYVDYMLKDVLPVVNSLTNNRLKTDRENLGISGCSLGGIMACHSAYTRPETFGFGACQSSSFWWPTQADANNGFEFLNKTLKTMQGPRLPQKFYIDVSMDEVDPFFAQREAAIAVADQLMANSPQFKEDETLFFSLAYGQPHSNHNCDSRFWEYIGRFSPTRGGPKNPNPPRI